MINWWGFIKKRGVFGTVQARKGGGVLGTGQTRRGGGPIHGSGQKRWSLPRHIPVPDLFVSVPPPPRSECGR